MDPTPAETPKPPISLNLAFLIITLVSLLLSTFFIFQNWRLNQKLEAIVRVQPTPTTYAECLGAPGSALQESYPATCVTKNGKRFKQPLTDEEKKKLQPPDETIKGTLEATVMRSPTCAGPQRVGQVCEAPVASETLKIIRLSNNEIVQTVTTDKDGKFMVSLASGTYQLQSNTRGIGKNISNPDFTITTGKTITQRFDVDTGIR
jgi:hypothetical protein